MPSVETFEIKTTILIKPTSCNYCKGKSSKSTCKSFITSLYCNFEVFTTFVLEKKNNDIKTWGNMKT